jgi:membrane protease YdiL (CAAX protease family)
MTDRRKTAWILGSATLIMFSPLAMVLAGYSIPMFQNLGFERETIAAPITWILATIIAIAYVLYTIRGIPFVASMQREISLFKLLGIISAVVGGIVEEVFFRRWIMDMFMSGGFAPIFRSSSPVSHLVWHIPVGHYSQSATSRLRFRPSYRRQF